jgi:hypothetical protein
MDLDLGPTRRQIIDIFGALIDRGRVTRGEPESHWVTLGGDVVLTGEDWVFTANVTRDRRDRRIREFMSGGFRSGTVGIRYIKQLDKVVLRLSKNNNAANTRMYDLWDDASEFLPPLQRDGTPSANALKELLIDILAFGTTFSAIRDPRLSNSIAVHQPHIISRR